MNLVSKVRKELKSAPGVTVTLRPLTERRRIALILATSDDEILLDDLRAEMQAPFTEAEPLIAAAKHARETGAENAEALTGELSKHPAARLLSSLATRAQQIQLRIHEAAIRAVVVAVDGFQVDGTAVDGEGFIEHAPADVFSEVAELAKQGVGMTDEDRGNSGSPITSLA